MQKIPIQQKSGSGDIDELIQWLEENKKHGANSYDIKYDREPTFACGEIVLYRILTEEEVKQNRIKELEEELRKLKQ